MNGRGVVAAAGAEGQDESRQGLDDGALGGRLGVMPGTIGLGDGNSGALSSLSSLALGMFGVPAEIGEQ